MFKNHHTAISSSNLNKSIEFYKKLGFKVHFEWEAEDKQLRIVHLKLKKFILEIFNYTNYIVPKTKKDDLGTDLQKIGIKHFALCVKDINKAIKKLSKIGLCDKDQEVKIGRTKIKYFFLQDPDNVFVEIVEDKR